MKQLGERRTEYRPSIVSMLVLACAPLAACGGSSFASGDDAGASDGSDEGIIFGDGSIPDGNSSADGGHEANGQDVVQPDAPTDAAAEVTADGPACDAGQIDCGGQCVSAVDVNHCGACTTVCAPPTANGSAACVQAMNGESCTYDCTSGYHPCGATCLSNGDDPSADPCVVANGLGIFASPTGSDANGNGTKEMPFATIAHAADVAATGTKRVYACGAFASGVLLTALDDGVTVFGGLDCASWAYSMSTPTRVAPAAMGYALQVSGTTTGVTLEDFVFIAQGGPSTPPASTAMTAQSSIAVFANQAKLTLARVTVNAASGQPGAAGGTRANWSGTAPNGNSPSSLTAGGTGGQNSCMDGTTSSQGGNGASVPGVATAGNSTPGVGSPNGGLSGSAACTTGGVGANGAAPPTSAAGAASSGSVDSSGWTLSLPGANGPDGNPGQGGGGGGSNAAIGAGGGGGAGGCGGAGGAGGATAGSSIAILAYQSTLSLTSCTVVTASGGAGGAGASGQDGQAAGSGAIGSGGGSHGCSGGIGGVGSGGAGGGGGAGGLSAGVLWSEGTAPVIDGTSVSNQVSGLSGFTAGTAGPFGPGGAAGQGGANAGVAGGNGASGQAADVISM